MRDLEPQTARAGPQPRQVLLVPEHAPADHAHALEDAVAVQKPVIGDRDARLVLLDDLAFEPDFHGLTSRRPSSAALLRSAASRVTRIASRRRSPVSCC